MNGRFYTHVFTENISDAATYIGFGELAVPTGKVVRVTEVNISQTFIQPAETEPAMITCEMRRHTATAGGGSTTVAIAHEGTELAGTICRSGMAAPQGSGDLFRRQAFNALAGMQYRPIPEERIVLAGGDFFCLNLLDANVSAGVVIPFLGVIVFEEVG